MTKRSMDFVLAAVGLAVTAPILLLLAAAVVLDNPGSPLFLQTRVGLQGRHFRIVKLRTMVPAAQRIGPAVTSGRDARITRVGHWLRRYKLDELPQLWNVLVGDMSLVGPRPEVPKYVAMYPVEVRKLVLSVRPGITDEASIAFRNENELLAGAVDLERAYIEDVLPRKLDMYVRYVQRRTLIGDLCILLSTARALMTRDSASG